MKSLAWLVVAALAACAQPAPSPETSYGAHPELPAPQGGLPTVNPATAVGWPEGARPSAAAGFSVTRYAEGLDHPRWLYQLPNGDVLVAESSTQAETGGGVMGWIRNAVQRRAGALHASANRITLLRDSDGDGAVDERSVFVENLNQPIGMALVGDYFYVANTDEVVRFRYTPGAVRLTGASQRVLVLPHREGDNGHWTRNLIASPDGAKLYVSVGSSSNIADYGMEAEEGRAAIWQFNPDGSEARIFASGLRNPVGMDWAPGTGALWVAVNERDMLGDNLVPDYITSVRDGAFYGWPYSYWGQNVDERVRPQQPDLVASAIAPDYALGAHTASLGLHFCRGDTLGAHYQGGAFIGQHGSWNRTERVGYKVVFVPFENGAPSGPPEDFLTGFLNERGQAQGRPVGVAMDRTGALLVADDVGDIVWRVARAAAQ
ncbi:MAG: sorbosone dehydrogenase family protein [Hyphomonadaceae bacterium]